MHIGFQWQMSNVSYKIVITARTIFIVTRLRFGHTLAVVCTNNVSRHPSVSRNNPLGGAFNLAVKIEKVTTLNA